MKESLKPNKRAYCEFSYLVNGLGSLVVLFVAWLALRVVTQLPVPTWMPLGGLFGLLLLWNAYRWLEIWIAYGKEVYIFEEDRIIARGGGILSSYEKELLIKNITHVQLILPYFQHRLYRTGNIRIHAAGGDGVEMVLYGVDNPEALYDKVLDMLDQNGLSVDCSEQLMEAHPEHVGVWYDTIMTFIATATSSGGTLIGIGAMLMDPKLGLRIQFGWEAYLLFGLAFALAVGAGVFVWGREMNRTYRMFGEVIMSDTYFFRVERTVVPMTNLSDSALQQGLFARVMGLYTLSLSCQGSGQEITFEHIAGGEFWKNELDALLQSRARRQAERRAEKRAQKEREELGEALLPEAGHTGPATPRSSREDVERDEHSTSTLKMDVRYVFASALATFLFLVVVAGVILLLPRFGVPMQGVMDQAFSKSWFGYIVIGGVLSLGRSIIDLIVFFAYTFHIRTTGFEQAFDLVIKKKVVFNAEKVTGIIVKQNPVDLLVGTCSIEFWSIGASDSLKFRHVPKDDLLLQQVTAKIGIYPKNESHEVQPVATLMSMLSAGLTRWFMLTIVCIVLAVVYPLALIGVAIFVPLVLVATHIVYRFQCLTLFDDYLWFRKGIIFREQVYARYDDIKYISAVRYPASRWGSLVFDVAGERVIQTDNGTQQISNRFVAAYIPDIDERHAELDSLFAKEVDFSGLASIRGQFAQRQPEVFHTSRPHFVQAFLQRAFGLLFLNAVLIGAYIAYTGHLLPKEMAQELAKVQAVSQVLFWLPIGLVAFDVLALAWITLSIRVISYELDEKKVSKKWGVFYKNKQVIHFADIDFIGNDQGAINKLFRTGNITVNTVGSSATDMILADLADEKQFYTELKSRYQTASGE